MTEISHFLKPGGWKITRTQGGCETMLPKEGIVLIGRTEAKGVCTLAWMDGAQCLRVVDRLQRQQRSTVWKGDFKHKGKSYWLTVWAEGEDIAGEIGLNNKKAAQGPATEHSTTGTWGAEAGGSGGGGGGGNVAPPPSKGKPNGMNAHS